MNNKKWISRFIIDSGVPMESGTFEFENCLVEATNVHKKFFEYFHGIFNHPSGLKMITIVLEESSEMEIVQIYHKNFETLEKLLNRISLIGYCNSALLVHVSTTILECEAGENFETLITHHIVPKKYGVSFPPKGFNELKKVSADFEISLGFFRRALTTNSLEEKILMLSTCLERRAWTETTDTVKKIVCDNDKCQFSPNFLVCEKCGNERNNDTGQKATKRYLKEVLSQKIELDNDDIKNGKTVKKIVKDFDEARNKIAHGSGERGKEFLDNIEDSINNVQSSVAAILAERLESNFVNANYSWVKDNLIKISGKRDAEGFECEIKSEHLIFNSIVSQAPNSAKGQLLLDLGSYLVIPFRIFPELREFYLPK